MMRKFAAVLTALVLLASAPHSAHAGAFTEFGPHFGFSSGPSQLVVGGHLEIVDVAPDVDFVPSVDLGFGDNTTLVSINGDLHYRFHVQGQRWQPYAGAGVGIHFYSRDNLGPGRDNSETSAGGHFIVGADVPTKTGSRFFTEIKLGFSGGPDFKALAGWSFRLH
jgi:hypothetical protein